MTSVLSKTKSVTRSGSPVRSGRRWPFLVVAIMGLGFVLMPLGLDMFSKASQGAGMIQQFRPFMTTPTLERYQSDMRLVSSAVAEINGSVAQRLGGRADLPPDYASFAGQWPAIDSTMTSLLDRVQGNVGYYDAVVALPSFRIFPWFFAGPGLVLLVAGAVGWRARRRPWRTAAVAVVAVIGVGLAVLPFSVDMFSRAPEGGHMMSAFKTIETPSELVQIQSYFSTMATGQGTIRLEVVPRLESAGLTAAQVASQYPATTALDANWIRILNDMTPMIGAMCNGVPAYQAVISMPPFALFPWFFLLPGVLILVLGALTYPRPGASS